MYLVKYSKGSWDDWKEINVFVTQSKEKAEAWVNKFNNLIIKWTPIMKEEELNMRKITINDWTRLMFERLVRIRDITELNKASYTEIEERI